MDLGRRPASPGAGGTVSGITTMDEDEDNVVSVCSKEGQEDNREQEQGGGSDTPALFVTGMPRDVWANPSLGALAALIDEADEEQQQGVPSKNGPSSATDNLTKTRDTPATTTADRTSCSTSMRSNYTAPVETGTIANPLYQHSATQHRQHSSDDAESSTNASPQIQGRHSRHRDAVRQRRKDRRAIASPYGGDGRPSGQRSRGTAGGKDERQREAPTAGEAQVLMSLWGI